MKRALFYLGILIAPLLWTNTASAGSISVQPLRQELDLKPGQSINNQLIVRNTSEADINVRLSAESFSVVNENYDYAFEKSQGLENWVRFGENTATIKPRGSRTFIYTVGAPNNVEPGAKYIAVFSSIDSKDRPNLTSIERVGTLLYITVPGGITKKGSMASFSVPLITLSQKASWEGRTNNTGTAHYRSRTTTEVKTIFGQHVSTVNNEHLILPNSVRRIDQQFWLGRWPGIYKAKITIGQGDVKAFSSTRFVIYAPPLPTLFIVAVGIIGLRKIRARLQARRTEKKPE